ncbi:MAG: cadherin-like domain-containing protein, partial [Planctomycetota bacterium]
PNANFNGSVTLNMNTALSAELEGHYSFESATISGLTVNDQAAGTEYDGTLNGNASIVNDATRGDVLSLDGTGDFVHIPGLIGTPANITLSGWINASGLDTFGGVLISLGTSPALYLNANGYLEAYYESGGTSNVFTDNENLVGSGWRHVAMTIDDATREMSVYLDGKRIATLTGNGPIEYDNGPDTYIGRAGDGLAGFDFNGMIDEARIYGRALSNEEIEALATDNTEVNENLAITVDAVNDAPTFSSLNGNPTFVENGSAVVLDADVQIFDTDIGRGEDTFENTTLTLSRNGGANSEDAFSESGLLGSLTEGGNLVYNSVTVGTVTTNSGGTLVLTFNSAADNTAINNVMQGIAYSNSSDAPPASVQIDWTFDDQNSGSQGSGGNLSATGTTTVNITGVNDAPVVSVNSTAVNFTEQSPVGIDVGATITDVDSSQLAGATVRISANYEVGLDQLQFTNQNGITGIYDNSTGILTLSGNASVNDYQTALRSIVFTNNSDNPSTATRTIEWVVNDGATISATVTRDIVINAANDDPTNTGSLPTDVTVTEDAASNIDLSAIDFADVDANGSDLTVTLSTSTGGSLALASDASLTLGGSPTSRTITGTLANLNAYFDKASNFAYAHGTPNTFGNNVDTITVVINDNGNTGAGGGTDQTIGIVNVDITAVNDSPTVATNTGATVSEGGVVTITTAMLNEADVDDSGTELTYTITSGPTNGQLELTTNPSVAISSFTQDDIDSNRVVFVQDGTQASVDSFDFSLADGGEDGA